MHADAGTAARAGNGRRCRQRAHGHSHDAAGRARQGHARTGCAAGALAARGRAARHARATRRRDAHRAVQRARSARGAALCRSWPERLSVVPVHDGAAGTHQRQVARHARPHAREDDARAAARVREMAAGRHACGTGNDLRHDAAQGRDVRPSRRAARQDSAVDGARRRAGARPVESPGEGSRHRVHREPVPERSKEIPGGRRPAADPRRSENHRRRTRGRPHLRNADRPPAVLCEEGSARPRSARALLPDRRVVRQRRQDLRADRHRDDRAGDARRVRVRSEETRTTRSERHACCAARRAQSSSSSWCLRQCL